MNWESFSVAGYLSVVMAVGTLLLWLIQWKKPARIVARAAMLLAVLAYAGAKVNSVTHVNRIEIDPAEQQAIAKAREKQRRQAALDSRGEEVADIRFAEDAEGEFYDRAGMDEADLKYLEGGDETPEWKKQKRQRGAGETDDDSLEGMIGAKEATEGVETDAVAKQDRKPPVLMSSGDLAIANRLDRWNLNLSFSLVIIGLVVLAHDYLRRANIYRKASLPLPLPGGLRNAVTPMPPVVTRPDPPRRPVPDELAWLLKRGESFVFFAADSRAAKEALTRLEPLVSKSHRADIIHVAPGEPSIADEFIFEALWHGRASFVVDDAESAERMMRVFVHLLEQRNRSRARVARTVHVVWDLGKPIPGDVAANFLRLAKATGFSLFLCRSPQPTAEHTEAQ